jgi:hypothetical protein
MIPPPTPTPGGRLLVVLLVAGCMDRSIPDGSVVGDPTPVTTATLELELTPPLPLLTTQTDVALAAADTSAYATFLRSAVQLLGGRSPARIAITAADLAVWTPGQWSRIEQIIGTTTVSVYLDATWVPFAGVSDPRGAGPVSLRLDEVASHLAVPLSPMDADAHPLALQITGPAGGDFLSASWTYKDTHLKLILHLAAFR